ncbi:hypothetical protein BPS13_0108 [Bacillus phage BPS13]|nr:hypothetical protein BPS13_0108 [Bacillus phage BPS13]AEZ50287.1 hypothetical protein BPS13_0108 [Bacillus phage BPS13]
MLIKNISMVDGATFKVVEISNRGNVGVWGAQFDNTMDYYKGLDKLRLTIKRIESINDFSLVNKSLLNL